MKSSKKTSAEAVVGPAQLAPGALTVHEHQLDCDENLQMGQPVEVRDESDACFAATVTDHDGLTWELTLHP